MGKTYYITESQMKKVISHIKEPKEEVIEEGFKEWVIGGLMALATIGGVKAQTEPITPQHIEAAEEVQKKLESGDLDLTKYFKDADIELNRTNLEKLKSVEGGDIQDFKTKNVSTAKSKMKQGYALESITITRDTIFPKPAVVDTTIQDTIEFDYSSDNMFKTASFQLKPEIINELNQVIDSIQSNNGKIINVIIESSTDTEPIKMGNEKLSQLRANSVKQVLSTLGVNAEMETSTRPDQGPDVYSTTMSSEEREAAREQTAEFRYVKVSFVVVLDVSIPVEDGKPVLPQVRERVQIELVKLKPEYKGTYKFKTKGGKSTKKMSCKKTKVDGKELPCSFKGGKSKTLSKLGYD
jgi:outer membrane protein OmpA-like peptidoglycan-associated protein